MKYSSTQIVKRFLEEDSPVKPGSTLIVKGANGDQKPTATELLAVKKTLPEGNAEYAAACLGLVASGDKDKPFMDAADVKVAAA